MKENRDQKILNQAFYATLFMSGLSLAAFLLGYVGIGIIGTVLLILFPTLGYLTKRGNKKAIIALLVMFIIDRVLLFVSWGGSTIRPAGMIATVFISFAYWSCFYKAYWVIRKVEKEKLGLTQ